MEKIHTKIKDGHALNLRVMLQGTPCEKEITDKDEEYVAACMRDKHADIVRTCGLFQASDREMTLDRMMDEMRRAAAKFVPGKATPRTFLRGVLDKAALKIKERFSAACRASHNLVEAPEPMQEDGGPEGSTENTQGFFDSVPDTFGSEILDVVVIRELLEQVAQDDELSALVEVRLRIPGGTDAVWAKELEWRVYRVRVTRRRLEDMFAEFLK